MWHFSNKHLGSTLDAISGMILASVLLIEVGVEVNAMGFLWVTFEDKFCLCILVQLTLVAFSERLSV